MALTRIKSAQIADGSIVGEDLHNAIEINTSANSSFGAIDVTNDLTVGGNTAITGSLTVDGSVSFSSSNTAGTFTFGDGDKLQFGDNNEFEIYFDGDTSWIKESSATGNLMLQGENIVLENTSGTNMLYGSSGAEISLYYNGSIKLATANTGVSVTGNLDVSANTTLGGLLKLDYTNPRIDFQGDDGIIYRIAVDETPNQLSFGHSTNRAFYVNNTGYTNFNYNVGVTGDLTVAGDFTVSGNTTSVNTNNLDVEDAVITLNSGQTTPFNTTGMLMQRYATANTINWNIFSGYDEVNSEFLIAATNHSGSPSSNTEIAFTHGMRMSMPSARVEFRGSDPDLVQDLTADPEGNYVASAIQHVFRKDGVDLAEFRTESSTGELIIWNKTGPDVANTHTGKVHVMTGGSYRLTALRTGEIGIGDVDPNSKLTVVTGHKDITSSPDNGNVLSVQSATGNLVQKLNLGVDSTLGKAFIQSVLPGTNVTDLLLNPAGGNVGIGTTNPQSMLTLKGDTPYITFERTGVPTWTLKNNFPVTEYGFSVVNETANTIPFFVGQSGNVGINHASPDSKLHVKDDITQGANAQSLLVENTQDGQHVAIALRAVADNAGIGNTGAIYFDAGANGAADDNIIAFNADHQTDNNYDFVIKGNGNVGVGVNNPAFAFQVTKSDASIFDPANIPTDGSGSTILINNTNTANGPSHAGMNLEAYGASANVTRGFIGIVNDENWDTGGWSGTHGHLSFGLRGSSFGNTVERLQINSDGYIIVPDEGAVRSGMLHTGPKQTAGLAVSAGGSTWVKLFRVDNPFQGRIHYFMGANNAEEMGTIDVKTTWTVNNLQLEVNRQTYNPMLDEVRLDSPDNGNDYEVWIRVNTDSNTFSSSIALSYQVSHHFDNSGSTTTRDGGIEEYYNDSAAGTPATNRTSVVLDTSGASHNNVKHMAGAQVITSLNGSVPLTAQTTSDIALRLHGKNTWTGIQFVDNTDTGTGASMNMFYNGTHTGGTLSIGGGGASVDGKRLHVDGGTTIGSGYESFIVPTNGLRVQGDIIGDGELLIDCGNDYGGGAAGVTFVDNGTTNTLATASTFRVSNNGTSANYGIAEFQSSGGSTVFYNDGHVVFSGDIYAASKSFDIEHPTKEGMRLHHGSLEGPEHGVYVRGRLKDSNIIELPDYWEGLVDLDTITVQLTAIGGKQDLWVSEIIGTTIMIGCEGPANCFYFVQAERKDVDKFDVEYEA